MYSTNPHPIAHTRSKSFFIDALTKVTEQLAQAWTPQGIRRLPHHSDILREFVEHEAYGLSTEAFARFTIELYQRVANLINSPHPQEKLAGVLAIDNLIDVNLLGDNAAKMSHFASHLSGVFHPTTDVAIMETAAAVMGHLVRSGGSLTAEVVDHEVKRSLTWLQGERVEVKRYAAVLLLKEMAENAPAVYNVHVRSFIEQIWSALRDPKRVVREAACLALRACLCLVEKRETRFRVQWYYRLFEETQKGLSRGVTVEVVHGSLLALGELLRHTGEFMLARYREVVTTVLRFRDSKERIIRLAVISLLPRLAHFSPERFAVTYLATCTEFLLSVLHQPKEKGPGFEALGDMAIALSVTPRGVKGLEGTLHSVAQHVSEALARRKEPCPEAIRCVGMMARAVGSAWAEYAQVMIEPMICAGLTEGLVEALSAIARHIPQLLDTIQEQLLDMIALVLSKRPFKDTQGGYGAGAPFAFDANSSGPLSRAEMFAQSLLLQDPTAAQGVSCSPGLVRLALRTLGAFDLGNRPLLDFVRERVAKFLDDEDVDIRSDAADACVRVLESQTRYALSPEAALAIAAGTPLRPGSAAPEASGSAMMAMDDGPTSPVSSVPPPSTAVSQILKATPYGLHTQKRQRAITEALLSRLLILAVSDPERKARKAVHQALLATEHLQEHLAQADCLRCLFLALNDENFSVRAMAIRLVGRLAARNPAYAMPAMRRHLLQLMTDLQHSPDSKFREESSQLLSCIIQSFPKLTLIYVDPLMTSLLERLGDLSTSMKTYKAAAQGLVSGTSAASVVAASKLRSKRSKDLGVLTSVLNTLGDLARSGGTALRPYAGEVLPLVIDCLQDNAIGPPREVIVSTLGDLVASTGCVVTPYLQYPQLMGILLYMLGEAGDTLTRRAVIKSMGIIGALDPYTHRQNEMVLQGEDQLDKEGVRAQKNSAAPGGNLAAAANANTRPDQQAAPNATFVLRYNAAGAAGDDQQDLLTSSGLMTSHEDYYPTVAINALVRVLRDMNMASHHAQALRSLTYIFQALGLQCVPYLPKVLPVLFQSMNGADDSLKQYVFDQLRSIVQVVKQHIRRHLQELVNVIEQFWAPGADPKLILSLLKLLSELSNAVKEDFHKYLPEILPRFIALITDAERSGTYSSLPPVFETLEALGSAIEDHLHLLLPAMVRLINPASESVPPEIARECLLCMRHLLPSMQLASYTSAVLHPLMRLLDGPNEALRIEAVETISFLAPALGPEFALFVPNIRKKLQRQGTRSARFDMVSQHVMQVTPPCLSDADDWETQNAWILELEQAGSKSGGQRIREAAAAAAAEPPQVCTVNEHALRRAWMSSERSTKEDWLEWMRNFSVELLKESPSPALRACHALAQLQPQMARELFPAGFVSCWNVLPEQLQEQLVRSLEAALASPTIPPEIVTSLLNLAEFMEHDEKALPLDYRTLGALAEKCHAFAKALHYKEIEFQTSPQTAVEALISINNHLRQPDAAVGILLYAQQHLHMEPKESLLEKLQRWEEALAAYEKRCELVPAGSPAAIEATLGRLRCLAALAEWDQLLVLCRDSMKGVEPHLRREIAPMAASSAWHMGQWGEMAGYVEGLDAERDATGAFLKAVLGVRGEDYAAARVHVDRARELLGTELAALVGESYERAYGDIVRIQQLTELEEVIEWRTCELAHGPESAQVAELRDRIRGMWSGRLRGVQRNVEVWQSLLSVRTLVLPMHEDRTTWVKFASLCRKSGRTRQATKTLVTLLKYDPLSVAKPGVVGFGAGSGAPDVMFAYLKLLWNEGDRESALARMLELYQEVGTAAVEAVADGMTAPQHPRLSSGTDAVLTDSGLLGVVPAPLHPPMGPASTAAVKSSATPAQRQALSEVMTTLGAYETQLGARVAMRLGLWQWTLDSDTASMQDSTISNVLGYLRRATELAPQWGKCWHHFALFNCAALDHFSRSGHEASRDPAAFVTPAVKSFVRSIALGQGIKKANNLQDLLRLLTLWFNYGSEPDVEAALHEGFGMIKIDTWLQVIPQVIARIHMRMPAVRALIHNLLVRIGRHHPQALMYPLLVACKSSSPSRRAAAMGVLEVVRQISASLVDQAQLVSRELIRVAILWHEMWHEALEEASRLYFGESNVDGMLATLLPLHDLMERPPAGQPSPLAATSSLDTSMMHASIRDLDQKGPTTPMEISFVQQYGRELQEAHDWCLKYRQSKKEAELHQAWDLYYHVFKRINKQLPSLTTLELQYVSPALVRATQLELAIPGTYIAGEPVVHIAGFAPQLHVITSKQRPRKLSIFGGDGASYMFLLKGHEDLRQDERVMQLFGLVNNLLSTNRATAERSLSIARYAVIPLSPNSGLIGWVPNCDTLHALIREFREARKIPLNIEHRLMLGMAPDYDHLTVMQKVEVFQHALESTSGEDLHKVLWLKSRTSELWLARRTNYTRSTAVMSMVGYILGLGDRHPSNLMLDRFSGKLLHIDFGDCFESSMHREKFPEKVPFRLTRMMIKAMEVSGIEGNFRSTCESVMKVLRSNKDSVMAMLEAFVHDPLINWRLLHTETAAIPDHGVAGVAAPAATGAAGGSTAMHTDTAVRSDGAAAGAAEGAGAGAAPVADATEALNERAVTVMRRMGDKLTGRDFHIEGHSHPQEFDTVQVQVQRLIRQATSHEHLSQGYVGWCSFW